ncbi:hypothetical protein [Streptomyces tateyamensis]|uniref:hypothetical protein n=1 Tax=Streptomyces tateyamensis TaxID=565073 RepID=UPI0011B62F6C|nr:hypothetical protein [Streptomyces tateyamensis]
MSLLLPVKAGEMRLSHGGTSRLREYLARFDDARRTRALLLADIMPQQRGGTGLEDTAHT